MALSVLPDIDHFICADNLSLKAANNLPRRPFLHWFGLHLISFCAIALLSPLSLLGRFSLTRCCFATAWLIVISFTSHVLRDARHRGLWLWPAPDGRTWMQRLDVAQVETPKFAVLPIYVVALLLIVPTFRLAVEQQRWSIETFAPLFNTVIPRKNVTVDKPTLMLLRPLFQSVLTCHRWLVHTEIGYRKGIIYASFTTSNARSEDASSKRWLARQRSDPYVHRARIASYRCRSAFKLLQLQEQIPRGLLHPGDIVVDCGAAPGSWSQVAISMVSPDGQGKTTTSPTPQGLVIALDLLDIAPIPGVIRYTGTDLRESLKCTELVEQAIRDHFHSTPDCSKLADERKANVVLCDIAPNASGLRHLDVPVMMQIAQNVLQLAVRVSAPGASIVIKLWRSPEADDFKSLLSRFYHGPWDPVHAVSDKSTAPSAVRWIKPDASRMDSSEIYLVARGFSLPSTSSV